MPLFSVVMPVYNVEKYLVEAINSVLNQTFRDFELIIVDDGSTDNCGEICDTYAQRDGRIRVIHQSNCGLLCARRVGIRATEGRYIVSLDSDDYCSNTLLDELKNIITKSKPDIILYDYVKVNEHSEIVKEVHVLNVQEGWIEKDLVILTYASSTTINPMWIKCIKKDIVDKEEDFSAFGKFNMAEDELQTASIFEKAKSFYYLPKSLYRYRVNNASITKKFNRNNALNSITSKNRKLLAFQRMNCSRDVLLAFYVRYIRTLCAYVFDGMINIEEKDDFIKYKNELLAKSIEFPKSIRLSIMDAFLYSSIKTNNYTLIRILASTYKWKYKRGGLR